MFYKINFMRCTLTKEILQKIGFYDSGEKMITDEIKWRLKVPYYSYEIQVVLGNYSFNNPNSGVLSLYNEEKKAKTYKSIKGKGKYKDFHKIVEEYITLPKREFVVAYYVNTPERLKQLISVLTYSPV